MLRKILVVDDSKINRVILHKMLSREYDILEAESGEKALEILEDTYSNISAVLLDLIMPGIDGYEVLARIRCNSKLSAIPVIVTTGSTEEESEVKALSLGANDFIAKPYSPSVIRHRLENNIYLRETAAYVNALRLDRLTGLYNREAFFAKADELIASREPGYYVMACFNINNFKFYNGQYGNAAGDALLKKLADIFRAGFDPSGSICGRIMADNFAVLYPYALINSTELENIRQLAALVNGASHPLAFSIGRYVVTELSLSTSAMFDRAYIAQTSVKARFGGNIAQYDESMHSTLVREQEIISEMSSALKSGQFQIWLQPQYDHSTGSLLGAEALVRWMHPQRGTILPGVFIPIFERNGFIYELDKCIWEQACALLRKWIDAGIKPLPLSVNVSRYDVFLDGFFETVTGLLSRYKIPPKLLRLEITESAFAKSTGQIISVVKKLIDFGITVEIDDFGSGYSSLNLLKDVPASTLKLDMHFLDHSENSIRGNRILESVVRMAKQLGMHVIAEGVETKAQADFLCSIGCRRIQGYLYSPPIPVSEYEKLMSKGACQKHPSVMALPSVDPEFSKQNNLFARLISEHSNRLVYRYNPATGSAFADEGDAKRHKFVAQAVGLPDSEIFSGNILPESVNDYRRIFSEIHSGKQTGGGIIHTKNTNGVPRWIDLKYSLIYDESSTLSEAVLSILDITADHEKELAYSRYLQTINNISSANGVLLYLESDVTLNITEKFGDFGLIQNIPDIGTSRIEIINRIANDYVVSEERLKCCDFFSRDHLITAFSDGARDLSAEWNVTYANNRMGYMRAELQMVQDPYSGHIKVYTILRDITDSKLAELAVRRQAELDGMTGLYNKVTAEALIGRRLSQPCGEPCALLIVDLDNLKSINDTIGHAQGDSAIKQMAGLLRSQFRKTDIIGRIGGDEFVVFLDGGGNEPRLRGVMTAFMRKLSSSHFSGNSSAVLHGSIGIAIGIPGKDSYSELFRKADKALSHVKHNGKCDFAFYTPEMEKNDYRFLGHYNVSASQENLSSGRELDNLLSAVAVIYPLVISVNLTQNSYYIMQYENFTAQHGVQAGAFDELISAGGDTYHQDDRSAFLTSFSRENLIAAHKRGEAVVSHTGFQLGDDGVYRHIQTDVVFVDNSDNDDILEITFARELRDEDT